jgi:hypothetical protein
MMSANNLWRSENQAATGAYLHMVGSGQVYLPAGAKIRLVVYQNSGSDINVQNGVAESVLSVTRATGAQGPQGIQGPAGTPAVGADPDTGWLETGFTPATGWSSSTCYVRQVGKLIEVRLYVQRTGADITAPASGNITDNTLGTIAAAYWPNYYVAGNFLSTVSSGGALLDSDGTVTLRDIHPTSTIATGNSIHFHATYFKG